MNCLSNSFHGSCPFHKNCLGTNKSECLGQTEKKLIGNLNGNLNGNLFVKAGQIDYCEYKNPLFDKTSIARLEKKGMLHLYVPFV